MHEYYLLEGLCGCLKRMVEFYSNFNNFTFGEVDQQ
jgi:hypothetical protein